MAGLRPLPAGVETGIPCQVGSSIGLLETRQLVIFRGREEGGGTESEGGGGKRGGSTQGGSHRLFLKLTSRVTSFHLCPLLIRRERIHPAHAQWEGITKSVRNRRWRSLEPSQRTPTIKWKWRQGWMETQTGPGRIYLVGPVMPTQIG